MAAPIFDGHNDTLLAMYLNKETPTSFFEGRGRGHIDLPRAQAANFAGGFFAMFTPPPFQQEPVSGDDAAVRMIARDDPRRFEKPGHAAAGAFTLKLFDVLAHLKELGADTINHVRNSSELETGITQGKLNIIVHFEGAEAIATDLHDLEEWYARGLRSLGPVWSRSNEFAHGVPFKFPHSPDTGPGLSEAGRDLVKACNRLGIMLDMAHMNEHGFWDVESICDAPLVVTHSCAHELTPSTRNLTDKQLDAIRANHGLVGCNFNTPDVRADGQRIADTPLARIVEHITYMVDRIGIEHVALGSDFDGAQMPEELGDVAGLPRLIELLEERGYDAAAIAKLSYQNWLRVLQKTWK